MSVTAELCVKMAATGSGDIGAEAFSAARRLVLDGLAVAMIGAQEPALGILVEHYRNQGSEAQATVLGRGLRLASVPAATINGAAMHVLDFEPMWSPANHALSTTLPAVLALAEVLGASGADALTALIKGIEIQGWLRQASGQWEAETMVFHPPGVVGPIGAAVAAGHLLGLGPEPLRHAVGIAASRSGALLANVGTMTKSLHCGNAAGAGLEAALLAARGFTANPDIFDVPKGMVDAFAPELVAEELLGFGPPFRVVEPGYAIKLFPCQYGTHFGITAALAARRRVADPELIRAVRFVAPVMAYVDRPQPSTGLAGKFSLQYTVAAALLDGAVGRFTFSDERLGRADMQRMLAKIELTMSPEIPGRFEAMHVILDVDLVDGTTVHERCSGPPGIWGAPPVSETEHLAKVEDCLAGLLAPPDIAALIDLTNRFDRLSAQELGDLMALAGTAHSTVALSGR